jgi:hypothetical protein
MQPEHGRGARWALLMLGTLTVLVIAASGPASALAHQGLLANAGTGLALGVPFAAVGAAVARRQPRNPIGWLSLVFAFCFLLSVDAGFYLVGHYRLGRPLPLAAVMLFLQPLWEVALLILPLVVLLFPEGRLPSARWRPVLWLYVALAAVFLTVTYGSAISAIAGNRVRIDPSGDLTTTAHIGGWLTAAGLAGVLLLVTLAISFAVRQALSWRRSSGERREQLKWLVTGAVISAVSVIVSAAAGSASEIGQLISNILGFGLVATPLGIGVGILKYRLYDIDRIISRTLSYAIITGLLVGVYAGLVLLITQVFGSRTPVAVAASTLAAAALFNVLRRRVQHAVDRRFNRARYDADETVTAFAARLQDAVDLEAIGDDLTEVVHRSLEPAHLSIWVTRPN